MKKVDTERTMSLFNASKYVRPYTQEERYPVARRRKAPAPARPPPETYIEPVNNESSFEIEYWEPRQPERQPPSLPQADISIALDTHEDLDQYDLLDEPKKDQIVNVIAPTPSGMLKRKNPSGQEAPIRAPKSPSPKAWTSPARVEQPVSLPPGEEKMVSLQQLVPQPVKSQPNQGKLV